MGYHDQRQLDQKLAEHLKWNTDEVKFESASVSIASSIISAINGLKPTYETARLHEVFAKAIKDENQELIDGLIRLVIFCANETPNRFKGIFPSFLVKTGRAEAKPTTITWHAAPKSRGKTIDISKLGKLILNAPNPSPAVTDFIDWSTSCNAEQALADLVNVDFIQESMIHCLSSRLAQGADTNRRGHGATDIIKERLAEWGFLVELDNVNKSDIPVSSLAENYSGPRKYDIVIKNATGDVCLVSQSQMYSSDVGSIQGKTVEEDATPNKAIKDKFPECCIVTHTEGFGCHTAMLSRLKHVLNSEIDGFIQLKTLDTKLRMILQNANCPSLLDYELSLLDQASSVTLEEIVKAVSTKYGYAENEARAALKRYLDFGLLGINDSTITSHRTAVSLYYKLLDAIKETGATSDGDYCFGGYAEDIYTTYAQLTALFEQILNQAGLAQSDYTLDTYIQQAIDRGVASKVSK